MNKIRKNQNEYPNVNNNVNNLINDNNVIINGELSKYSLNKNKFTPNTKETILAEKIASALDDLENYACYLSVVKEIGCEEAEELLETVLEEIEEKKDTRYPIRKPGAYFMWRFKKRHRERVWF